MALNTELLQVYRIEVFGHDGNYLPALVKAAHDTGIVNVAACRMSAVYFLKGALTTEQIERLCREVLADPVVETYQYSLATQTYEPPQNTIEVTLLPGVTDPVAESLLYAAQLLNINTLDAAATGQRYQVEGTLTDSDLQQFAEAVLCNTVIQRYTVNSLITPPFILSQPVDSSVETIVLRGLSDSDLLNVSRERRLALDLAEMQAIQRYFVDEQRDPTDAELEMLAQTWSEHCVHKTFKAVIDYTDPSGTHQIDGLLKTYIRAATEKLDKPWVRSAFVDNAGIVAFDNKFDLAFKVETHNHPSALEPFGGANTGVGGVVRDVLGVSARPIANTDVLCFGPQDLEQPPSGVLHPRRVADGVVAGIEDYGNKMGIPTINGAILYQEGYTANPLVFCGCLGILPHGSHPTGARAGDLIVLIGGRTGRDGLRGATFSSMEMDVQTSEIASVSVQIGHPIHEKQVLEVMLRARDEKLYSAVTDCGAGGLSSAVGEMAGGNGASVQLETVPLKYPGLRPWEIWLSEAQERMVLAVPPENWSRMQEICRSQNLEGVCIGQFEATGRLRLTHNGQFVGDLSIDFLHDGIPQRHLKAQWQPVAAVNQSKMDEIDPADTLLRLLEHPNIRSKESVVRRYDHEVQGATAVKPFTGVDNHGPSDAAVLVPLDTLLQDASSARAVALSNGINPFYGLLDPYLMAWAAVDEAVRNLVAVGADPDQIAILDNFCWGNPNLPDRLGALVRCVQGCYDAALAYGTPFISGKDSLNNEYADADGVKHAIPGTLLISAMGIVPDVRQTVTMDLKQAGNYLYLLGETRNELGGSHYHLLHHLENGMPPQPVPQSLELMRRLHQAMRAGLVRACHDVSEGGIAVSLAEMCIAGRLGAEVYIHNIASPDLEQADLHKLFTESSGRFIVEVEQGKEREFAAIFEHYPCHVLGVVRSEAALVIKRPLYQHNEAIILDLPVGQLEKAWRGYSNADVVKDHSKKSAANTNGSMYEQVVQAKTTKPKVLILHATGTNRDRDAALACELAGGTPEIVHVNQLLNGDRCLRDYHMLVIPGGFSYGDDLGAGMLWSLEMQQRLNADISHFVQEGRPVIGICNGFQMLAKAGLLDVDNSHSREITLTKNQSRQFECRWVYLQANSRSHNLFIRGVNELIYCPVAHGEGRIASTSANIGTLAALYYADVDGNTASTYPLSPNGSIYGIAGLSNAAGNVLGLMPHPENHIFSWQHPRWRQGESGMDGLRLFKNGIKHA